MAAVLGVPAGDTLEDRQVRVATGWPRVAVDQPGLGRGEEAFSRSVYLSADLARPTGGRALVRLTTTFRKWCWCTVRVQGVLPGLGSRSDESAGFRPPRRQCQLQCIRCQLSAEMVSHRPAHDIGAVCVERDRQL